jgi:sensor histidine kinase regulating citrate/malate metabolism
MHKMRSITASAVSCPMLRFSIKRQTFQLEIHEISRNFAAVEL